MEAMVGSLALVAALVIFSVWGVGAAALLASSMGFRRVAAVLGVLSAAAGVWLLLLLPHAPILGGANILAGLVAIGRCYVNEGGEE